MTDAKIVGELQYAQKNSPYHNKLIKINLELRYIVSRWLSPVLQFFLYKAPAKRANISVQRRVQRVGRMYFIV